MKDFIMNNAELIGIMGAFLIGWFLPNPKVNQFGKSLGEKIPEKLRTELAEKLDALEQGLRGMDVGGDGSITSNEQISEEIKKTKIDLGLEESKSKNKV